MLGTQHNSYLKEAVFSPSWHKQTVASKDEKPGSGACSCCPLSCRLRAGGERSQPVKVRRTLSTRWPIPHRPELFPTSPHHSWLCKTQGLRRVWECVWGRQATGECAFHMWNPASPCLIACVRSYACSGKIFDQRWNSYTHQLYF